MKRCFSAALAALLCLLIVIPCVATHAESAPDQPIRIALLNYPRYCDLDENGRPVGMAVAYLDALSRYTGWTYEYVPLSLEEAREQLQTGEIDMIPGRSHSFCPDALYASKAMGTASCVLVCRADDARYAYRDYDAFQGMRVGMLASTDYEHELSQIEAVHNFTLERRYFTSHDESLAALQAGDVDALLMISLRKDNNTKDIARFASTDLYMAVTPSRPELLEELNRAQGQLFADQPECLTQWTQQYYGDTLVSLNLTRGELDYLAERKHLRVGLLDSIPAYSFKDSSGQQAGIVPDLMSRLGSNLNLDLEFVTYHSVQQLIAELEEGKIDLAAPLHRCDGVQIPYELTLASLVDAELMMAGPANAGITGLSNLTVAVGNDSPLLNSITRHSLNDSCTVLPFDSLEDALDAVLQGKAHVCVANSLSLQSVMRRPRYDSLSIYSLYSHPMSMCLGFSSNADERLVSALVKSIAALDSSVLESTIIHHTVSSPYGFTINDALYRFRQPLFIALLAITLIGGVLLTVIISTTIHRRRLAASRAELEKETQQRHALEMQREADERHREELHFLATHDPLTGLYNINGFELAVHRLFEKYPERTWKIVRMDVYSFKVYNDLFGAEAGDAILTAIADLVDRTALPDMAYARLNTDHFIFCLEASVDIAKAAHNMADWLHRLVPGYELQPTFGEYIVDDPTTRVSIMCDRALVASQSVKGLYPPKIGHYTEDLRRTLLEEQWITANMRQALAQGEFIPYFQPQYHLYTGHVTGAEVLVRWQSREKGFITPGTFIPIFEKNGFITEMDLYIWELSCQWLHKWLEEGNPPIALSVNASRLDVRNLDLTQVLPELVARYDLRPDMLRLEITESAYMQDPEQLIRTMKALQDMGFTIEMDDFGSGYSSLNLLKDVPVDVLKLDMRFLSAGDAYGRSASIIRSVVNMSKWLNLHVIAEGVETAQQSDFLKSVGCSHAQGYRYSRPLNMTDFEALLRRSIISHQDERRHGVAALQPDRVILTPGRKLIMLVDDREVRRRRLREILGTGYDYIEAESGQSALNHLFGGLRPDCIILDGNMPELSGTEVLRALRSRPETAQLLVIMIVPISGADEAASAALGLGLNDVIYTPFFPELIRQRVQNQLLLQASISQAQTDGLTGLLNRTALRHVVENALEASEGSPMQGMMMVIDLDHFKALNDQYGHPFGDKVLTCFADMLSEICGEDALVGRLGGDEFAVLTGGLPSREDMKRLISNILEQTRQIVIDDEHNLLSCSIGASIYPTDFVRRSDLYAAADQALYAAKQQGLGNSMFYDELPEQQ